MALIMPGFKDQMNKHELCLIMAFSGENSLDWGGHLLSEGG